MKVIFQIGNREDMAVGTSEGNLAVKILDEYVKDFQKRNPTLRVFNLTGSGRSLLRICILTLFLMRPTGRERNGYQSFTEAGIEKSSWISRWK